ncbi:2OG-Fe(II) oxygenase [Pelagibius sp. Alg239-R121]|uniref:HalD/BesD family halogenase n=1 Tax=Pelagibius sp. Alg239-R121 TaxID=2993448 RepID=UPI0024A64CA7|nr:2OG-Fe(II) oxygenase [Pelagibius sp. Alg239-R121]
MELDGIVDLTTYPLEDQSFRARCRAALNEKGVLVMPGFMTPEATESVRAEGSANRDKAYFCSQNHTVYLSAPDPAFSADHTRNRMVVSSKGCITDDQVPDDSALRTLYNAAVFRDFLCETLGETELHDYADSLSSINIHYAETGQELGWHFDNSSFAITLMIEPPERGGSFEYVRDTRNADAGEMNYEGVAQVLNGRVEVERLSMNAGALVLFRGRNAIHRVAPNEGARTRMLAVLAYNSKPGVSLSEEARMTFYGRTG